MKYFVLGLGEVSKAFLKLLKIENIIDFDNLFCIEKDKSRQKEFMVCGGKPNNFIGAYLEKNNFHSLLKNVKKDDFLLDFTDSINTQELLIYCIKNNIHYLSTADSFWPNEEEDFYKSYLKYKKIKQKYCGCSSCLIEFGMNPGLVSIYAKKCIEKILLVNEFSKNLKKDLFEMYENNDFGNIARILKIKSVKCVDIDSQLTNLSLAKNTVYSFWNCNSFHKEATSYSLYLDYIEKNNLPIGVSSIKKNQYRAIDFEESTVLNGKITYGYVMTHEEVFTLGDLFCLKEKNRIVYRPAVKFIYKPSDISIESIKCSDDNHKNIILLRNNIISGGEYVGISIDVDNVGQFSYGNYCDSPSIDCSPTIFQVAVSCLAGFKYLIKNKKMGLLFPEDLDTNTILSFTDKYLPSKFNDDKKQSIHMTNSINC